MDHWSVVHVSRLLFPKDWGVKLLALFITAKLDDSGSHGPDYTVMGGYVATETQWENLESKWMALLSKFGIKEFHSVALSSKHWWPEFSRCARIIFNQSSLFSIQAAVINSDYKWFKTTINQQVRRYRADSIYAMSFRQCMIQTCYWVGHKFPGEQVSFVLEEGHRNWADALRVFRVTKHGLVGPLKKSDLAPFLHGIAFAPKIVPAMQMADFCANGAYQDLISGKFEPSKKVPKGKFPKRIRILCTKHYFENKLIPAILAEKAKQRAYADMRRNITGQSDDAKTAKQ